MPKPLGQRQVGRVAALAGGAAAGLGLTAIIARIASEDQKTQMQLVMDELKPRLVRDPS